MTREELDRLRKYSEVTDLDKPPLSDRAITALLDHIDRLERERDDYLNRAATLTKMWDKKVDEFNALQKQAEAGRELREAVGNICCDWPHDPNTEIDNCCNAYDTATKETDSE